MLRKKPHGLLKVPRHVAPSVARYLLAAMLDQVLDPLSSTFALAGIRSYIMSGYISFNI